MGSCEGLWWCLWQLTRSCRGPVGPGDSDAGFSLELAQLWEVGASLFLAPGIPPRKVILRPRKEKWSFRKNHALLRAEGMTMPKHGVEEMIGHRARSGGPGQWRSM